MQEKDERFRNCLIKVISTMTSDEIINLPEELRILALKAICDNILIYEDKPVILKAIAEHGNKGQNSKLIRLLKRMILGKQNAKTIEVVLNIASQIVNFNINDASSLANELANIVPEQTEQNKKQIAIVYKKLTGEDMRLQEDEPEIPSSNKPTLES